MLKKHTGILITFILALVTGFASPATAGDGWRVETHLKQEVQTILAGDEYLWVLNNLNKLYRVHKRDGEAAVYNLAEIPELAGTKINQVVLDKDGEGLWFATDNGAFLVVDGKVREAYTAGNHRLPANRVTRIRYGPDGDLWFGTSAGLAHLKPDGEWEILTPVEENKEVSAIAFGEDGSLWVAFSSDYTPRGSLVMYYVPKLAPAGPHSMEALLIPRRPVGVTDTGESLAADYRIDPATGRYVASAYHPIDYRDSSTQALLSLQGSPVPEDKVFFAVADSDRRIWYPVEDQVFVWEEGKEPELFYTLPPTYAAQRIRVLLNRNRQLPATDFPITRVLLDEDGAVWVSTLGDGVLRQAPNGEVEKITAGNSGLPENYVSSMAFGEDGTKWFGTQQGLAVRKPDGTWLVINSRNSPIPDAIRSLTMAPDGGLWVTTYWNLGTYHLKPDSVVETYNKIGYPALVPGEVTALAFENDGSQWAAPRVGGHIVHLLDGQVVEEVSIGSDTVTEILLDRDGTKWFVLENNRWNTIEAFSYRPPFRVILNGEPVSTLAQPYLEGDSLYLPLRPIAEAMGLRVEWETSTKTITLAGGNTLIRLSVGKKLAVIDGKNVPIDTAPTTKSNTTFIPLHLVAEVFGADVTWDEKTGEVKVSSR